MSRGGSQNGDDRKPSNDNWVEGDQAKAENDQAKDTARNDDDRQSAKGSVHEKPVEEAKGESNPEVAPEQSKD